MRDAYISAPEALELGLADEIITPKKRGSLRQGKRKNTFSKSPTKKQLRSLVNKLFERIHIDIPKDLTIHSVVDENEVIEEYDNSVVEVTDLEQKDEQ
jgi:hypothetical protein